MKTKKGRLPRVVYFNPIPSPYFVSRFNAIAEDGRLDFSAIFDRWTEGDRQWTVDRRSWKFNALVLIDRGERLRPLPLSWKLITARPRVFVTLWHSPIYMFAAVLAKVLGSHICFRVLETHDSWNRRSRVKEMTKRILFSYVADSFETSGPGADAYARRYVKRRQRKQFFHTTQSVDLVNEQMVTGADDDLLRFLYVGRMIDQKGVDVLLRAFAEVAAGSANVVLEMVGDGEALDRYRAGNPDDARVTWHGFLEGEPLQAQYRRADVFVFPTLGDPFGLVLTEAMASGCAVITSSAAGELQTRVVDAGTGFVVEPGNSASLAAAMRNLAQDPDSLHQMQVAAFKFASTQSHRRHASDFIEMISKQIEA